MKVCKKCGIEKSLSEFSKDNRARGERPSKGGQGAASACRLCVSEIRKPGLAAERHAKKYLRDHGLKRCSVCGEVKPLSVFHQRKPSPDGLAYKCSDCIAIYCRLWRGDNPGAFKQWYAENKHERAKRWKLWYEQNKEQVARAYRKWARANPHIVNALIAKRNAAKKSATPGWANLDAMRSVYKEASRLTMETGIRHEVDHVYPIQGELVCGLHCEANLQIMSKTANIRKGNKMPAAFT